MNRADPSGKCLWDLFLGEGFALAALADAAFFVGTAGVTAYGAHVVIQNRSDASDKFAPDAPKDTGKKDPPNPKGSRGSQEQDKIKDRIGELEDQGHTDEACGGKKEETVRTPGGDNESRRPDVNTTDPNGKPYRENVGRDNKNGTPVSRGKEAQEDIQGATGQCAFTAYDCKR
jgi:hypothetical protein